jgi:urease accessory protein
VDAHVVQQTVSGQALERATGAVRVAFKPRHGRTVLDQLYQEGTAKLRLPNTAPGRPIEAVVINTGGGMTGGDRLTVEVTMAAHTAAAVTTQACEKVYRALHDVARVTNRVMVGPGAHLHWLPQETIVFDHAGLSRSFTANLAGNARLLAIESIVLGRTARGETVRTATIRDSWRVHRDGKLIWADALRIDGSAALTLQNTATGGGARALATVLYAAPDAESWIDDVRACLGNADAGVSAWNGMMVVRIVSPEGAALRRTITALLPSLSGGALPRTWWC